MYAILNTKTQKLATISFSSNGDAEFCNDTTCTIGFDDEDSIFVVESRRNAESVFVENVGWYNSSPKTPTWGHSFERELSYLKVVKLKIEETV